MDYRGQQLCEYIYTILVILFGSVAWIYGYLKEDFTFTFYGWAVGLALSLLLCIPDWPIYNRHKVFWLDDKTNTQKISNGTKSKGSNKRPKK